ncbi:ribonuclease D [Paraglaciecola hydrolytica]|uniref:Ribonuclease D n=1 Tax=Paraglaciecola hydrolytica TaxID=1799789 RepID=A0A136A088_9ALTE|nr:ribonuclease D [Paraglaciecola hydrolytica]KXI28669.1 ribonuclease D [Paraglaciecola hydrolytica]
MQYTFITDTVALESFCTKASLCRAIAVDTEFVRTRTLYPQLGLIQLFDGEQLVLVDPQKIDDFSSLTTLLTNPDVVKVLHSCSEDLETFWQAFKIMPAPVFDSQFAASVVGMGTSLGYAKLVELMLNVTVDKGESRTDWLARPLSEEQCAYAANDVLYLLQLYPELKAKVEEQGKLAWIYAEIAALANKKQSLIPLDSVYLGITHNWQLSGKSLLVLQRLAAWRMETARQRDMALNFVVKEQNLLEIAKRQPKSKPNLLSIPGINHHEVRIHGDAILAIVESCQHAPVDTYPPRVERLTEYPQFKQVSAAVRDICVQVAEELAVPIEMVGSKKQVNQLISWCWFKRDETQALGLIPDLISNWRAEYFIPKLTLLEGLGLTDKLKRNQSKVAS